MKKLWLVLSLMVFGLSACYIEPIRIHDGGYNEDQNHREGRDRHGDRDGRHHDHGDRDRDH